MDHLTLRRLGILGALLAHRNSCTSLPNLRICFDDFSSSCCLQPDHSGRSMWSLWGLHCRPTSRARGLVEKSSIRSKAISVIFLDFAALLCLLPEERIQFPCTPLVSFGFSLPPQQTLHSQMLASKLAVRIH